MIRVCQRSPCPGGPRLCAVCRVGWGAGDSGFRLDLSGYNQGILKVTLPWWWPAARWLPGQAGRRRLGTANGWPPPSRRRGWPRRRPPPPPPATARRPGRSPAPGRRAAGPMRSRRSLAAPLTVSRAGCRRPRARRPPSCRRQRRRRRCRRQSRRLRRTLRHPASSSVPRCWPPEGWRHLLWCIAPNP